MEGVRGELKVGGGVEPGASKQQDKEAQAASISLLCSILCLKCRLREMAATTDDEE